MKPLEHDDRFLLGWLLEEDPVRLATLWQMADAVRRQAVGDAVHLRGLVEISNICVRQCAYCGLRAGNANLERYRMSIDEIMICARRVATSGYGTVVLQSGEDYGITKSWLAALIRRIKTETSLAVTLSLGERKEEELAAWRKVGADRYLLRFETSDRDLYQAIHPGLDGRASDRIAILKTLRALGYEIGSGIMVGLPGQSIKSLVNDIRLFQSLDLDMIGIGPFIPHPATPLGAEKRPPRDTLAGLTESETRRGGDAERRDRTVAHPRIRLEEEEDKKRTPAYFQVPASESMVYKVMALARLACSEANIPSTTALSTVNRKSGRELGLKRGANVVMPNFTPQRYRAKYEIYPHKVCIDASDCSPEALHRAIVSLGRSLGKGAGGRRRSHTESSV